MCVNLAGSITVRLIRVTILENHEPATEHAAHHKKTGYFVCELTFINNQFV